MILRIIMILKSNSYDSWAILMILIIFKWFLMILMILNWFLWFSMVLNESL